MQALFEHSLAFDHPTKLRKNTEAKTVWCIVGLLRGPAIWLRVTNHWLKSRVIKNSSTWGLANFQFLLSVVCLLINSSKRQRRRAKKLFNSTSWEQWTRAFRSRLMKIWLVCFCSSNYRSCCRLFACGTFHSKTAMECYWWHNSRKVHYWLTLIIDIKNAINEGACGSLSALTLWKRFQVFWGIDSW